MVMAAICLIPILGFVAFTTDVGVIALNKTRMQCAVDAAALAAAQEITSAVEQAGENSQDSGDVSTLVADANAIAEETARQMAAHVAELNDVYVDPDRDVEFGKRVYDPTSGGYLIQWSVQPYNVVRVTARRDNAQSGQPDSRLQLFFAPVLGHNDASLTATATAFVEARDIVVVLDYSGSMNDDSEFRAMSSSKLGKAAVEANMDDIWNALVAADPKFTGTNISKFPAAGLGLINSPEGTYLNGLDDDDALVEVDEIIEELGLNETDDGGNLLHPYPQEGKNGDGSMKGMPSASRSHSLWRGYVNWVRSDGHVNNYGYRHRYGYRTLVGYLLKVKRYNNRSEDLWRTPHYPFQAMKDGVSLFTEFLTGLEFGDHIGMVNYDTNTRIETELDEEDIPEYVDIGEVPITDDYAAIDTIQRHKQAGHYGGGTGIGAGIQTARQLLLDHGRYGSRPTILLMTDGLANKRPGGWSLPSDWDWADVTDYDGDGSADYTSGDADIQYAFWEAKQAIDAGFTIHTISVGTGADRNLMKAIAQASGGIWIDVPGGSTVSEMEAQMLSAFSKIAANVPPAKLLADAN